MRIKRKIWGFDSRYHRCEHVDETGQPLNYVFFESRDKGDARSSQTDASNARRFRLLSLPFALARLIVEFPARSIKWMGLVTN